MRWLAIGVVVLAGCSSHDLTCAVLASRSNCFAQEVTLLAACVPMSATPAKLSADQTTCTFADGVSIVFNAPLPSLPLEDSIGIAFTIFAADATECGRLDVAGNQAGNFLSVSDGGARASWELLFADTGDDSYALVCPAHTYTVSPNDTFACPGEPDFVYSRSSPYSFTVRAGAPSLTITCQ